MRHTQPMTAEESRVDLVMRKQHRTHAEQDAALTLFRLAHLSCLDVRSERLESVANLLLGERRGSV